MTEHDGVRTESETDELRRMSKRDCDCRGPNVKASRDRAVSAAIEAWNGRTVWASPAS